MSYNVSLNGEEIYIKKGVEYILIDILYFDRIRDKIDELNFGDFENDLKKKVFPFSSAPFAKFIASKGIFKVADIKKSNLREQLENKECYFSCDSALMILIRKDLLIDFINENTYDDIVDAVFEGNNSKYWQKIWDKYENSDVGIIMAPGTKSGYEFEGGGVYKIRI